MPLISAVAAAREKAFPSSSCSVVVVVCVGREERFSGRTLYPAADALPAQNPCNWDKGHHEQGRWCLLLRKTREEELR